MILEINGVVDLSGKHLGASFILYDSKDNIEHSFNYYKKFKRIQTSNTGKFYGLGLGLRYLIDKGYDNVTVMTDSSLVHNIMNGNWQAKNGPYVVPYKRCRDLNCELDSVVYDLSDNFLSTSMYLAMDAVIGKSSVSAKFDKNLFLIYQKELRL